MIPRWLDDELGRVLRFARYKRRKDPFAAFEGLPGPAVLPPADQGTVLLLPIRVTPVSNLFEGLVGYAMRLRGYKSVALMCGRYIDRCENQNLRSRRQIVCSLCKAEQHRFCASFDIEGSWFADLIPPDIGARIRKLANDVPLTDIPGFIYEGVPTGKHVIFGMQRFLLQSEIDLVAHESLLRKFFHTSLACIEATRRAIALHKPKFVLSSHGIYSTWGAAIETCLTDGVPVVTWARGYVGSGNLVLSHGASYLFEMIYEPVNLWETRKLTPEDEANVLAYFAKKRLGPDSADHVSYYKKVRKYDPNNLLAKLGLDPKRRRLGMYPNIPWDGTAFCATKEFPSVMVWLAAVIDWAQSNPSVDIVIRAHPAERRREGHETVETFESLLRQAYPVLPPNVLFLPPEHEVSSYALSEICESAIIFGSTLSLEFAVIGHPVIQTGMTNVTLKGVVFDCETKADLFAKLDMAAKGTLVVSEEMRRRAMLFAFHWVNKKHLPEEVVNLDNLSFESYKIRSKNELATEALPVFNFILDRCLDGKPFILP